MSEHTGQDTGRARWPRAFGHGRVFALGMAVLVGVGAATVGITWATGHSTPRPVADISPIAAVYPGTCTLQVGNRAHTMDVDRARTLTMIAGVGTQVGAVPQQTARAFDVALSDHTKYLPAVNTVLTMLAQGDTAAPTPISLAEIVSVSQPGSLSCTFAPVAVPAQHQGSDGLTPRADAVRSSVLDAFGKLQMAGGPAAAAAPAGTALTVTLAATNPSRLATGWVLANWLVARGSAYALGGISFDQHTWKPTAGWNAIAAAPTAAVSATTSKNPSGKPAAATGGAAAVRDLGQMQIVVN